MRIVGDIHGKWKAYMGLVSEVDRSIQVGDFGAGFKAVWYHDEMNTFHANGKHRFIRGNHDNPAIAKTMAGYIPDGTYEDGIMYVGGAWSIDQAFRLPGHDWWPDEELSEAEFGRIYEEYVRVKPSVMITHDIPRVVAKELFFDNGPLGGHQHETRTGIELQRFFDAHQPDLWVFGHWHISARDKLRGTEFYCLNELEYIDI